MSETLVGRYVLGFKNIRLFTRGTSGGDARFNPPDNDTARITVGLDDPWPEVIATLLHEAYEISLVEMNARYELNPGFSYQSSRYVFMIGHDPLDECHSRVAYFVDKCLADLRKHYESFQLKKSKAEARKKKKK